MAHYDQWKDSINYSRLDMSTEFFFVPVSVLHNSAAPAPAPTPTPKSELDPSSSIPVLKLPIRNENSFFRREIWVPPLLVLSILTMLLIILFEIFVLGKMWRTIPSRRHLFLGQMLLAGLFICSLVSATLMAEPSTTTCAIVRFGIGFGYSLIFATLLVKCVFLISLNGGVYLPASYQALLLCFAVAIQVAINVQWLMNAPPSLVQGNFMYPVCEVTYHHILLSLVYVMLLIMVVTILSLKSRRIRDNYREAMFISITMCCIVPIWLGWIIGGLMVLEKNRDACLAFGLTITSVMVFLIMFMPKSRQLAAMGRDGTSVEEQEQKLSSLNRAASSFFFHLKPVKSVYQTSAVNTFGDRVALVTAVLNYAHPHYPCCYLPPQSHACARNPQNGSNILYSNVYTSAKPTMSSNSNVFFQRNGLHPSLIY